MILAKVAKHAKEEPGQRKKLFFSSWRPLRSLREKDLPGMTDNALVKTAPIVKWMAPANPRGRFWLSMIDSPRLHDSRKGRKARQGRTRATKEVVLFFLASFAFFARERLAWHDG